MDRHTPLHIQGIAVSEGIAIGELFFACLAAEEEMQRASIPMNEVDEEIARYRRALLSSRQDLLLLQENLHDEGSKDAAEIIDAHIQMLQDPLITTHVEEKIRQMRQNTEAVFRGVICDYEKRLSMKNDQFFQQRLVDVMDISKRILGYLTSQNGSPWGDVPEDAIVFAKELLPSHVAAISKKRVHGYVTHLGSSNSHAALIARSKGIPFVSGIDVARWQAYQGQSVIVDGMKGEVLLRPTQHMLLRYSQKRDQLQVVDRELENGSHLEARTLDGHRMQICANIGTLSELEAARRLGAEGVGLFRSEYLFLEREELFLSEEMQYRAYMEFLQQARGSPFVLRVLDMGGDKQPLCALQNEREPSGSLGARGIRFLLRYQEIFRTQLRAILRASLHGDVRLLLPMVSEPTEVDEVRRLIVEVSTQLVEEGQAVKESIPVGCMIEVPSAVLLCEAIARKSDFLSLGTNDLIQYTMGIDRSHPSMGDPSHLAHPSLPRIIRMVIGEAQRSHLPLSVCGEIASNPLFLPLLMGLGIRELSCAPRYIPLVKRAIRSSRFDAAQALANRILQMDTTAEVAEALAQYLNGCS